MVAIGAKRTTPEGERVRTCPQCNEPLRLVGAVDVEGDLVDVHNEEGELVGEEVKLKASGYREFWQCVGCGEKWPA